MPSSSAAKDFIVYVDDDEDDLQYVSEALSHYSQSVAIYTFQSAGFAYRFLLQKEAQNELPCLIVLDINMPRMTGKELLPLLRSISSFKTTPVILFTTSNSPEDYRFAQKYGASFITKPVNAEQMKKIGEVFLQHCSVDVQEIIKR